MSKPKKKTGGQKQATPNVPAEWLYMVDHELAPRALYESLEEKDHVELWEDAGVIEISMGEKSSMDMEMVEPDLQDEVGNEFLAEHNIKCLYLVDIPAADYNNAEQWMRKIIAANGGFFCGDTEDFTPVVGG